MKIPIKAPISLYTNMAAVFLRNLEVMMSHENALLNVGLGKDEVEKTTIWKYGNEWITVRGWVVWCSVQSWVTKKHILNVLEQVIRGLSGCAQTEFSLIFQYILSHPLTRQVPGPLKLARTISVSNTLLGIYSLAPKYFSHRLFPHFVTTRLHSSTM